MLTWQAENGRGFEGTRLTLGAGAFRALGRQIRVDPEGDFTSSYGLVMREDGTPERLSVTSATARRERNLTINRTEEGYWLLDTGSGGTRTDFDGATDVDLAYSAMFTTLPIRRLGLHRTAGQHTLRTVFVALPSLEIKVVEQTYRTVSVIDETGHAVVAFSWGDFAADLVVDADGFVESYPGIATRVVTAGAAGS
ncbi:MAG: putative glycolipid-binding domain-containing protein [Pseudonocardia sp.]|nr:putative glycolipid-binding domain-containing protein [Pseudonocardia sp.]